MKVQVNGGRNSKIQKKAAPTLNKKFIISILFPLVPFLLFSVSWLFVMFSEVSYLSMQLPPLAPPLWAFALFSGLISLTTGTAVYIFLNCGYVPQRKKSALAVLFIYVFLNSLWPPLFLICGLFNISSVLTAALLAALSLAEESLSRCSKAAGRLMFPALLLGLFSAYIVMSAALLN